MVRLALILILALVLSGRGVLAHDGNHAVDQLATVTSATQEGHRVAVSLLLTGLGGPLVLVGVAAQGAQTPAVLPVYVNFAEDVAFTAELEFAEPPPERFTLELDFGPAGQGGVEVAPRPGRIADPG